MKLVLHIGAHKTATTSIQRTLANNRAALLRAGIWYPSYSEIFPSRSDHYAHLDVAKGLMSDSKRFTPDDVARFFEKLHRRAQASHRLDAVLISAEPFYRGRMPVDAPFAERRKQYVARLKELAQFDDVEVVLVLRRQDDYLESLYNEHVKVTRYAGDIWSFLDDYRSRFEYRNQITLWSEYFPVLKVFTFEELIEKRTPTLNFLKAVFGTVDVALEDPAKDNNVSLPVDLVDFKRHLNGTSLSRPELSRVVSILENIAAARDRDKSKRWSRLSADDRRNVLTRFESDNAWINEKFFANRPGGLFPSEIKSTTIAPELDLTSCMDIVAEILSRPGSGDGRVEGTA